MYSSFARVYDELMRDVDREAWAQYIVELLGGKKPLAIAECACGTGALTIPLHKLGYNITGFDSSEDMRQRKKVRREHTVHIAGYAASCAA